MLLLVVMFDRRPRGLSVALPAKPLLAPWYRLVGDGDRLLLEHGQSVVVLEGGAVRALLPALLPLLDGTRTVDELAQRLGTAVQPAIELALELLDSHGLLVEGPDAPRDARAAAHAVAAVYDLAPAVAAERLARASVGVVGGSTLGFEIGRLLHAAGIADIRQITWRAERKPDLVVVAAAPDELDALPGWNRLALDRQIRWLAVRPYDGRFASVGPLIVPDESCCWQCVLLRRAANVEYGDDLAEIEAAPVAAVAGAPLESLVAGLAAHLVIGWLVGRNRTLPGVMHAVELRPTVTLSEHHVLRVPRCDACSEAEVAAPPLPWHAAEAA